MLVILVDASPFVLSLEDFLQRFIVNWQPYTSTLYFLVPLNTRTETNKGSVFLFLLSLFPYYSHTHARFFRSAPNPKPSQQPFSSPLPLLSSLSLSLARAHTAVGATMAIGQLALWPEKVTHLQDVITNINYNIFLPFPNSFFLHARLNI